MQLIKKDKTMSDKNIIGFQSRNCPVKPFELRFLDETLTVRELSLRDKSACNKLARFTVAGFIESTPEWEYLKDESYSVVHQQIKYVRDLYDKILSKKNKNNTVLIAEDSKKNIKASFILESFNEIPGIKDEKTGYLTQCLIDKNYRGLRLGSVIIEKLLETAQGCFTDIFTEANPNAIGFYKRAGFEELDFSNPLLKRIGEKIRKHRKESETVLISKSIDSSNPWYERIGERFRDFKKNKESEIQRT